MTIIPHVKPPLVALIDAAYEGRQESGDHRTLRCSQLGEPCDRALWYRLRWAHHPARHEGRLLRIFDNGHQRERMIVAMLSDAGMDVQDVDPATGEQWRVSFCDGMLTGSADGVVTGVPEAPKARHLLEIKTMNDARWNTWRRKGVKASDPKYWVQCQLYMHGLGLDRCLFIAENQNTRELDYQRLDYDAAAAVALVARAERIVAAGTPPARINDNPDWWECKRCPAYAICHGAVMARRTCRSCAAFDLPASRCARHKTVVGIGDVHGCDHHLYIPELVPGDVVDVADDGSSVTYTLASGETFVDGMRAS